MNTPGNATMTHGTIYAYIKLLWVWMRQLLDTVAGTGPNSRGRIDRGARLPSRSRPPAGPVRPAMTMTPQPPPSPNQPPAETDPRFPSGPWQGFFLMAHLPGRHQMELHLNFRKGIM